MTHKELFLKIGQAYETPYEERTPRQRRLTYDGICLACEIMKEEEIKSKVNRFTYYINQGRIPWLLPTFPPYNDIIRADLCYLFAAMTRKEFNEMGKGV